MTGPGTLAALTPAAEQPALTAEMAEWVAALTYEQIPNDVIQHLKLCLLDTLGCGIYGSDHPAGHMAARFATLSGTRPARVWGKHPSPSADVASAAFANGTAVHVFEIDDVHLEGQIHPESVVVPAVFALSDIWYLQARR